jgi:putative ABC transport system permease protein
VINDLHDVLSSETLRGLAEAAVAVALCAVTVARCRLYGLRIEREASLTRGFAQMICVGLILAFLLHGGLPVGALILVLMMVAAAFTAAKRVEGIEGARLLCLRAIVAGAGVVLLVMFATGSLAPHIAILVPVGSMMIANAMNACAQAIERFRAEILSHVGEIEAGLVLGADPATTVAPYLRSAVYASLLPRLDMLKSLGLVWIPGVMAGMMVSGASPVYASIYQFIIVAMILAATGITGLAATVMVRVRAFTPAAQLAIRPGADQSPNVALAKAR